jgi:hypothetical protein
MIDLRMRNTVGAAELESKEGRVLTAGDYNVLLTGPTTVRKPDGSLLCVYLPKAISASAAASAWPVLHSLAGVLTDNRGLAAGSGRETRGTQTRSRSKLVPSAIIGAIDPGGQYRYCRLTAWTGEHLNEMRQLDPLLENVAQGFAEHVPDRYGVQQALAERTAPEWRLGRTPFTTLTVNNTYPTGVHVDKGDLPEGFSTIVVLRRGDYDGCELVFPRYRIGVDMGSRDLILMDAHEWHGNTAFRRKAPDAERISLVCYYRTAMAKCGSAAEEERRAHQRAGSRSGLSV